jgi:hypothetical protein
MPLAGPCQAQCHHRTTTGVPYLTCTMLGWLRAEPRAASMTAICSRLLWRPPWAPASGKPGSVITLTAAAMPRQVARYTTPKVPLPEAAQHSTAQHSTAQHSTAQHSTAQHSTSQHSTARVVVERGADQIRTGQQGARSHAGGGRGGATRQQAQRCWPLLWL